MELIWVHIKTNPLANVAPVELDEPLNQTHFATDSMTNNDTLLRSLIKPALFLFA